MSEPRPERGHPDDYWGARLAMRLSVGMRCALPARETVAGDGSGAKRPQQPVTATILYLFVLTRRSHWGGGSITKSLPVSPSTEAALIPRFVAEGSTQPLPMRQTRRTALSIESLNKPEPLFYDLKTVADLIGLGRSSVYSAVRSGDIPVKRFGGQLKVPASFVRQMESGDGPAPTDVRRKRHSPRSAVSE